MTESLGKARPGGTVRPARPAAPPLRAASVIAGLLALVVVGAVVLGHFADDEAEASGDGRLRLEVWERETQQVLYDRRVVAGETFELRHNHSVTRRPVVETFSVAGAEGIAIEQLWFDQFGPNLPAGPEAVGDATFRTEPGGYRVIHHGQLLPTVPVLVGSTRVDHVLTFEDGERLRLLDLTRPRSAVELRILS